MFKKKKEAGEKKRGRETPAFAIGKEQFEKSKMKNDTQTGKTVGPWPYEDPIFNHILDKSDLKSQAKKHSLVVVVVCFFF